MKAEHEPFTYKFNPKHNPQHVLQILKVFKQASHDLYKNLNTQQTDSNIKALLELEHELDTILYNDPYLNTLSTHLTAFRELTQKPCNVQQRKHGLRGLGSFVTRRVNSLEISRLAGVIESEIQTWIDREFIKMLTQTLVYTGTETKEEVLIDLIEQFQERISTGFERKLQDLILRTKVFTKLELILCERKFSKNIREAAALAIAELISFNKDVFVGQVLISKTVCALISLASVRSIQILCTLIKSIKSPLVDEIVSAGKMIKLVAFLASDDVAVRAVAMECVLEIGYFGRKEALDAMLEEGLVKRLVELQRCENKGVDNDNMFVSCVARFAVQLEIGEGLRGREKRELKQEVLKRVREVSVCEAEAATIVAEVLWGASP